MNERRIVCECAHNGPNMTRETILKSKSLEDDGRTNVRKGVKGRAAEMKSFRERGPANERR